MRQRLVHTLQVVCVTYLLALPSMAVGQNALEEWLITVATGDATTVAAALAASADPNGRDEEGRSALYLASAYNPDPTVVLQLIRAGADPNVAVDTTEGLSALMVAAGHTPNIAVIRTLLDAGADPSYTAFDGTTALHRAAYWRARPVVSLLPDYFFDILTVDLASEEGDTLHLATPIDPATRVAEIELYLPDLGFAFSTAILTIHPDGATIEIERAPPFPPQLESALLKTPHVTLATAHNDTNALAIARLLIEGGADVRATDARGETVLHLASWLGDETLATYLLQQGAGANTSDAAGNTPLMRATQSGNIAVISAHLERDANPNARTNDGATALHSANDPASIQALVAHGAHVNARTGTGNTPLHHLVMRPTTPDTVRALLAAGADLEAQTLDHTTPLMLAARYAAPNIIATLLDAGADARAPSASAANTMDLARRNYRVYDSDAQQPVHDIYWRLNDAQFE